MPPLPWQGRRRPARAHVLRVGILLVLFAVVLVLAIFTDVFDSVTPRAVHEWVRRAGPWAPAFYLAGFVARPLTLLPLTIWLFAGGVAFGWTRAVLYALVGVNLGAAAVFLAARALGRDYVMRFLGNRLPRLRRAPVSWGTRVVLSLQLMPFMHHDLLNVAAGCSRIPYWRFLMGSMLGTLPGIVIYTYAGSVLMAPGSKRFYAVFAALAALSVLSLVSTRLLRQPGGVELEDEAAAEPDAPAGPSASTQAGAPGELPLSHRDSPA